MGQLSAGTVFYVDYNLLREMILKEMAVRVATQYRVTQDTGINTATVSKFLSTDPKVQQPSLSADAFVTFMRWGNFPWGEVVKRRRGVGRHTDTKDQQELRKIAALLEEAGVKMEAGESVSDLLARVIGSTKK